MGHNVSAIMGQLSNKLDLAFATVPVKIRDRIFLGATLPVGVNYNLNMPTTSVHGLNTRQSYSMLAEG